jgi:BMFP domain-containing protein YqiC
MEIKEAWEITIDGMKIEDEQLREQVISIVRTDTKPWAEDIRVVIEKYKNQYISQQYSESDLIAEVKHLVNLLDNEYRLTVELRVYPLMHPEIYKYKQIIRDAYMNYMSESKTKERNDMGKAIKEKVAPLYKIIQLQRENFELRKRLEVAQQQIEELRKRISELEGEQEEEQEEDP